MGARDENRKGGTKVKRKGEREGKSKTRWRNGEAEKQMNE